MSSIKLTNKSRKAIGKVTLDGSKSISNRVLIIRALCMDDFNIDNLSTSDDTQTLARLLEGDHDTYDAHHAGTTYRFLTSYLATRQGSCVLTGSDRMKQRPIGPLVTALQSLSADISYMENDGFPPLKIRYSDHFLGGKVSIDAGISSQFISSLLLIAPVLERGLEIELLGDMVSKPYLQMTLEVMKHFGVDHTWEENRIHIKPQSYKARDYFVEADWSAASYYYSIAALAEEADIVLKGLSQYSLQGDSAIAEIGTEFGISTSYLDGSIRIVKGKDAAVAQYFEYDFILCPDIAQTVAVMCAGLGVQALFSGLQTLYIKETDRVAALQNELQKVNVFLTKLPEKFSKKSGVIYHMIDGRAQSEDVPKFETYQDHRMAMSLAPLAMLLPVEILDKEVVSKSYPKYWEDVACFFQ